MVAEYHGVHFPLAIVRPSIVGAVAGLPCPGFFGNSAGATAYIMAFAIGALQLWTRVPISAAGSKEEYALFGQTPA